MGASGDASCGCAAGAFGVSGLSENLNIVVTVHNSGVVLGNVALIRQSPFMEDKGSFVSAWTLLVTLWL